MSLRLFPRSGTYLLSSQIVISQSNFVLRGAGNATTTLLFNKRYVQFERNRVTYAFLAFLG